VSFEPAIPADVVVEKQVLGIALYAGGNALIELEGIIQPADFFTLEHGLIFSSLLSMFHDNLPVELASVAAEFRRRGVMDKIGHEHTDAGGADYLMELAETYGFDTSNLKYYANILRNLSRQRQLITLSQRMGTDARGVRVDTASLIERCQEELYEIGRSGSRSVEVVSAGQAVSEAIERADNIAAGKEPPGLMTGFAGIDNALGGFQAGDLVTLGAATSVGKSALATTIAAQVASDGGTVFVVSAEMPRQSVANRLLAAVSGIANNRLRNGNLNEVEHEERIRAEGTIKAWRLAIYDSAATVAEISTRARMLAARWRSPLSLVIVDYLQLMRPTSGDNRAQEVSGIAWGLKQLGMELACPVLMLSQLNRAGIKASDDERPPGLHDLKESGDVENHSNTVLLLHRSPKAVPDTAGAIPVWCKVAKARDGEVTPWPGKDMAPGSITLRFRPELTRFDP
jgi:replicative DNA helicase